MNLSTISTEALHAELDHREREKQRAELLPRMGKYFIIRHFNKGDDLALSMMHYGVQCEAYFHAREFHTEALTPQIIGEQFYHTKDGIKVYNQNAAEIALDNWKEIPREEWEAAFKVFQDSIASIATPE